MLELRVIKKFHDAKGILIGYRIQDVEGNVRDVYKEQLKNAVINGQCKVVNMTLTSDGRLIGKASPVKQSKKQVTYSGEDILEIYNNGKKVVAALINKERLMNELGGAKAICGWAPGITFDVGHEAIDKLNNNLYDNIKLVDGKPDISAIKRKPFKNVRNKLIKGLEAEIPIKNISFNVTKMESKYDYKVSINNEINNTEIAQLLFCLLEDSFVTSKIKVLYIDEDSIIVQCMTGISDVRKAAKLAIANK